MSNWFIELNLSFIPANEPGIENADRNRKRFSSVKYSRWGTMELPSLLKLKLAQSCSVLIWSDGSEWTDCPSAPITARTLEPTLRCFTSRSSTRCAFAVSAKTQSLLLLMLLSFYPQNNTLPLDHFYVSDEMIRNLFNAEIISMMWDVGLLIKISSLLLRTAMVLF